MRIYFYNHTIFVVFAVIITLAMSVTTAVAEPSSQEPIKLKVLLLPYLDFAPLFIAQEEGYFSEQGLEIEFVRMPSSAQAIPALLHGELDIVGTAVHISLLNAIEREGTIKIVSGLMYIPSTGCSHESLVVRKDWLEEGKLENLDQEKLLQAGVLSKFVAHYYLEKALLSTGIDLDRVVIKRVPPPVVAEALQEGTLDIASLPEPFLSRALQDKNLVMWLPTTEIVPNQQFSVLAYGQRPLAKHPEIGERFMVAYLKAVRQFNQGKTPRNIDLVTKFTGLDRDLVQTICWPSMRDDGNINSDSIVVYQAWAVEKGWLDRVVTPEEFWDDRFITYANEVLRQSSQ